MCAEQAWVVLIYLWIQLMCNKNGVITMLFLYRHARFLIIALKRVVETYIVKPSLNVAFTRLITCERRKATPGILFQLPCA